MRPFGYSFPKLPAVIQQWPLLPSYALLDEFGERRITKYTGQWTGKTPQAGVGRELPFSTGGSRPEAVVGAMSRWRFDTRKRVLCVVYDRRHSRSDPLNFPRDRMLFEPARHEPLLNIDWDAARARAAIVAIVDEIEATQGTGITWPWHPL